MSGNADITTTTCDQQNAPLKNPETPCSQRCPSDGEQKDEMGRPQLVSWASEMSYYSMNGGNDLPLTPLTNNGASGGQSTEGLGRTRTGTGSQQDLAGAWDLPSTMKLGTPTNCNKKVLKVKTESEDCEKVEFSSKPPPKIQSPVLKKNKAKHKGKKSKGARVPKPGDDNYVPPTPEFDRCNLIINYLPPEMESSSLKTLFSQYGNIVNSKVVIDHNTGYSKGFGFVKYEREEDAARAIENLNEYKIGNKTLKVSLARKNCKRGQGDGGFTNLYIANLDKNINNTMLKKHFSKCGYIVQCRVLKDNNGVSRRIGFVRYDNHQSALRAIDRYDGKRLDGGLNIIQCRFANTPRKSGTQTLHNKNGRRSKSPDPKLSRRSSWARSTTSVSSNSTSAVEKAPSSSEESAVPSNHELSGVDRDLIRMSIAPARSVSSAGSIETNSTTTPSQVAYGYQNGMPNFVHGQHDVYGASPSHNVHNVYGYSQWYYPQTTGYPNQPYYPHINGGYVHMAAGFVPGVGSPTGNLMY